jgi:hypothetical protein
VNGPRIVLVPASGAAKQDRRKGEDKRRKGRLLVTTNGAAESVRDVLDKMYGYAQPWRIAAVAGRGSGEDPAGAYRCSGEPAASRSR